jgi:hypothetical protein
MPLNYLGWTEDIEGYSVVEPLPLATTGENKMLIIAKTPAEDAVWIGDGIQRRQIPTPEALTDYQWGAANGRLNIYKGGEVQTFDSLECLGQAV